MEPGTTAVFSVGVSHRRHFLSQRPLGAARREPLAIRGKLSLCTRPGNPFGRRAADQTLELRKRRTRTPRQTGQTKGRDLRRTQSPLEAWGVAKSSSCDSRPRVPFFLVVILPPLRTSARLPGGNGEAEWRCRSLEPFSRPKRRALRRTQSQLEAGHMGRRPEQATRPALLKSLFFLVVTLPAAGRLHGCLAVTAKPSGVAGRLNRSAARRCFQVGNHIPGSPSWVGFGIYQSLCPGR